MSTAFLWGGIGVLILFILIGFFAGLIRGLKRSALHLLFFAVSFVIAIFITKPITSAILGISINYNGTPTTLNDIVFTLINKQFNLSDYQAVGDFAKTLPLSVASPIMFIIIALVTYLLFDIIYLIVARVSFGKKKQDFSTKKPLRWYGSAVGAVEGFLFMFLLFAPLTSLTQTYQSLATYDTEQAAATTLVLAQDETQKSSNLPLLSEVVQDHVPNVVNEAITQFNNSVIGKISGAGGLNHALFDYLSSSKVNQETIHLRKDLLVLADTYNEFAVAYNTFLAKDYGNLELTALKEYVANFLDEGLFKGVIAPTVQEFVVKFDVENAPDVIKNNELLSDLVGELKTAFSKETFVAKTYLKDDLLKLVDIADELAKSGLIEEFQNFAGKDAVEILEVISSKNTEIKNIVDNAFELNILNDGFHAIGNFASQKLADFVENENVKLNLSAEDKSALISNTLDALDDVLALNAKLPFSSLMGGNLLEELEELSKKPDFDLATTLVEAGEAFDKIRELEILVLPAESPEKEKTFVLDEILKGFHVSLLGDTVHVKENGEEKTIQVKTYKDFFKVLSTPVGIAQKLGLLKLGQEGTDFEQILNALLDEMQGKNDETEGTASVASEAQNPELLSQILLPFYELEKATFNTQDENMTIRKMIFDKMIDELDKQDQLSFESAKQTDTYENWKSELDQMGETLLVLDDGNHTISSGDGKPQTYIRYLLSGESDFKKLLDQIVKDKTLKDILKSLFKSSVFDNLVDNIFEQLDEAIEGLTGAPVTTSHERLKTAQDGEVESVAEIFETMLDFANNTTDMNNLELAKIGELLDKLKDNANNNGTKDGVFNAVFENLIWYLTGDDISTDKKYKDVESSKKFDQAEIVKGYLTNNQETVNYYEVDFTAKFTEIANVRDFLKDLQDKGIKDFDFNADTEQLETKVGEFVNKFEEALSGMENEEEKLKVLKETKDLIDSVDSEGEILSNLPEEAKSKLKEEIKKIFGKEGEDNSLADAILDLLGLKDAA